MGVNDAAIHATRPVDQKIARSSDEPWVRWTSGAGLAYAIVDAGGPVVVRFAHSG